MDELPEKLESFVKSIPFRKEFSLKSVEFLSCYLPCAKNRRHGWSPLVSSSNSLQEESKGKEMRNLKFFLP